MKVTLPPPPSANVYWKYWRGRVVPSPEAKTYKRVVRLMLLSEGHRKPLAGPVVLSLVWYRAERRGDLSNRLKVLEDALNGIAFNDDSQVVELHCRREDDKLNPRVVVTVEAAE